MLLWSYCDEIPLPIFLFHAKILHYFFPRKEQKNEEFRSMSLIKISEIKFWNMLLFSNKYFALPIIIDYLLMVTQKLFRALTSSFRRLSNLKELWNGQRNVESGHHCACCWYPLCVEVQMLWTICQSLSHRYKSIPRST